MHIYAVAGGDGSGKTATALNLAVAFRAAGQHAAVLDANLTGNVSDRLGVDHERTLADVIDGRTDLREAIVDHPLSPDRVPESALLDYRRALMADRRAFRTGERDPDGTEATDFPDVDALPVIGGWASSRGLASVSEPALDDALQGLVMAYDCIVVDTGGESIAGTAPVAVSDGVALVTTPDQTHVQTATQIGIDCQRNDAALVGAIVNRVGDDTSITDLTGRIGIEAAGVIPADDRTHDLEPVRYSAPDSPAANAYDRLTDSLERWHDTVEEASGTTDGGGAGGAGGSPRDPGRDRTDRGRSTDDRRAAGSEDEESEDDGGFLGGLFG